tara:strand:+ start:6117 stop:6428 length:312 start_codon:yes stop_codon:yes gene_type:complete
MILSRYQAEVESICDAGVESYIANKHKEYRKSRLEVGAMGAFLGIISVLGISIFAEGSGIKLSHAIFPIGAALIVSGIDAIVNADKKDEDYTEEFNDVCDNIE